MLHTPLPPGYLRETTFNPRGPGHLFPMHFDRPVAMLSLERETLFLQVTFLTLVLPHLPLLLRLSPNPTSRVYLNLQWVVVRTFRPMNPTTFREGPQQSQMVATTVGVESHLPVCRRDHF